MMKDLRLECSISLMAVMFDVSVSGYYSWLRRKPSRRAQDEPRLVAEVKAAHERTRKTYGVERLQSDLSDHGVSIGIHRLKRIRRDHGIKCKQRKKYKVTTDSKHCLPLADNHLDQKFSASSPNKVWVTDLSVPQQAA